MLILEEKKTHVTIKPCPICSHLLHHNLLFVFLPLRPPPPSLSSASCSSPAGMSAANLAPKYLCGSREGPSTGVQQSQEELVRDKQGHRQRGKGSLAAWLAANGLQRTVQG